MQTMYKFHFSFLILLSFSSFYFLKAQDIDKVWEKSYEYAENKYPGPITSCKKGGYLFISEPSYDNAVKATELVKIDKDGKILWKNTIPDDTHKEIFTILEDEEGSFYISGHHNPGYRDNKDAFIMKTSYDGKLQWIKSYGGEKYELEGGMIFTRDGNIALGITSASHLEGYEYDFGLSKIDKNGDVLWTQYYSFGPDERVEDLLQLPDGSFVLFGTVHVVDDVDSDYWLVKTDESGKKLWDKRYDGNKSKEYAHKILYLQEEKAFLLAGGGILYEEESGMDAFIIKTDMEGNILWQRTYGGNYEDFVCGIIKKDTAVMVVLTTRDDERNYHIQTMVLNKGGDILQSEIAKDLEGIYEPGLCRAEDGGVVMIGGENYGDDMRRPKVIHYK
jgi:hypothetical protein